MVERQGNVCHFRVRCPGAESVHVVGDFSGWNRGTIAMRRADGDHWQASIPLSPGDYRFRYLADGTRWITDYAAFGVTRTPQGEWDSVLHVPEC